MRPIAGPGGGDALARAFEAQRPRLVRVAYATVGSVAEAEDCVQEAWLRLRRVGDPAEIRDLGAWLTTTVSRLALDALGRDQARRERYVGPWLPEPLVEDIAVPDPADRVTLDESVSMALLVVLERLTPAERTSFLLHDVFGAHRGRRPADHARDLRERQSSWPRVPASMWRKAGHGSRPPTPSSGSWSPRSRPHAPKATWSGWSPCSIRTSCGVAMAAARSRPALARRERNRWRPLCSR